MRIINAYKKHKPKKVDISTYTSEKGLYKKAEVSVAKYVEKEENSFIVSENTKWLILHEKQYRDFPQNYN